MRTFLVPSPWSLVESLLQPTVLDGDTYFYVSQLAQHEYEAVAAAVFVIAAFQAFQASPYHLYLLVKGKFLGRKGNVVGRGDFIDNILKPDHLLMLDCCQDNTPSFPVSGPVGQEQVYMGPLGYETVCLFLADARDEDEAGYDEPGDDTFGAVGVNVKFLLAWHVTQTVLWSEMVSDVLTAGGCVLLVFHDGYKPFATLGRVKRQVETVGGRHGRATRFVHYARHNRLCILLTLRLFCHCLVLSEQRHYPLGISP